MSSLFRLPENGQKCSQNLHSPVRPSARGGTAPSALRPGLFGGAWSPPCSISSRHPPPLPPLPPAAPLSWKRPSPAIALTMPPPATALSRPIFSQKDIRAHWATCQSRARLRSWCARRRVLATVVVISWPACRPMCPYVRLAVPGRPGLWWGGAWSERWSRGARLVVSTAASAAGGSGGRGGGCPLPLLRMGAF